MWNVKHTFFHICAGHLIHKHPGVSAPPPNPLLLAIRPHGSQAVKATVSSGVKVEGGSPGMHDVIRGELCDIIVSFVKLQCGQTLSHSEPESCNRVKTEKKATMI